MDTFKIDSSETRLVDYSSSEGEEFSDENIKDGDLDNIKEDKIREKLQHKALDLSKVAVVQPLLKYGTLENKKNDEGTVSDNLFGQNTEDNLQNNQQQIQENFDQGLDFILEEIFENAPPPSSPVNNHVPLSTPVNFLEAFQAFINVRKSAESSQQISEISEQSVEDEDSSFICVSSEESQNTEICSPPTPNDTAMSPNVSDNESDAIIIDDSLSHTTGM